MGQQCHYQLANPGHWADRAHPRRLGLLCVLVAIFAIAPLAVASQAQGETATPTTGRYELETISRLNLAGSQQLAIPESLLPLPAAPIRSLTQSGPTYIQPGDIAHFTIQLRNTDNLPHSYELADKLPAGLDYLSGSAEGLTYNPGQRSLTWHGTLPPGNLNYIIEPTTLALPYLDLADFGIPNLCEPFLAAGEPCDDVAITFNLGTNDYSAQLYERELNQVTVSVDGLLLAAANSPTTGRNQWLPDAAAPSGLIAPLWRDVDMTAGGRWHAAIISGLLPDHDLFYVQWHDAPQTDNPDQTARFALALVLDPRQAPAPLLSGHLFYVYDNIADLAGTIATGYTVGIEDSQGRRGTTHAFAPCCGGLAPPQGEPPAGGSVLHLRPVLFDDSGAATRTFRFAATVTGAVPETLVNTVSASTEATNPAGSTLWASHYLYVRFQHFLPLLTRPEVGS